jgi:hypothetical protein
LFCCVTTVREWNPRPVRARGYERLANNTCVLFVAHSAKAHAGALAGQDGLFPPSAQLALKV